MSPVSLSHTHALVLVRSLCLLPVFCYATFIYLWALKYISFKLLCVVGRIREVEGEEEVSLQAADSPVMHAALCRKLQQEKEEEGIYNYKQAPVFKNFTESSC